MSAADSQIPAPKRRLPFVIEDARGDPIALAANGTLALAMFRAALTENPDRALRLTNDGALVLHRFA